MHYCINYECTYLFMHSVYVRCSNYCKCVGYRNSNSSGSSSTPPHFLRRLPSLLYLICVYIYVIYIFGTRVLYGRPTHQMCVYVCVNTLPKNIMSWENNKTIETRKSTFCDWCQDNYSERNMYKFQCYWPGKCFT